MKKILQFVIMTLLSFGAYAQTIQSYVKDTNNQPIPFVNIIVLSNSDNSLVTGTITDSVGKFTLEVDNTKDKRAIISFIGYKTDTVELKDLTKEIVLLPDESFLPEVEIKSTRQIVKLVDNCLQYDAQAVREKKVVSSAFDLIKELPSVYSQDDNSLTIVGTSSSSILINGRVTTMSYSTLIEYLKSLPAERVKHVEIAYNAPAEWSVSGAAMNIVLEKVHHRSYSGQISSAYVNQYANSVGYGGAGFLSTPKWNIDLSFKDEFANVRHRDGLDIHHNVLGTIYDINSESKSKIKNHCYNVYSSVTYNFNDSKNLNFSYVGTYIPKENTETFTNNSYTGSAKSENHSETYLHNFSLHYQHGRSKDDDILSFNAGGEYTNYRSDYDQKMQYGEYVTEGSISSMSKAFVYDANQKIDAVMAYLNITNRFKGGWTLAYGGRFTYTTNKNEQMNKSLDELTDNYTTNSSVDEYNTRLYVSLRKKFWDDKINLNATLTNEYNNNDGYKNS